MSLTDKAHFPLILFDDDFSKTPLSNTNKNAWEWWTALSRNGQQLVLEEFGIDSKKDLEWDQLREIYRSVHSLV